MATFKTKTPIAFLKCTGNEPVSKLAQQKIKLNLFIKTRRATLQAYHQCKCTEFKNTLDMLNKKIWDLSLELFLATGNHSFVKEQGYKY